MSHQCKKYFGVCELSITASYWCFIKVTLLNYFFNQMLRFIQGLLWNVSPVSLLKKLNEFRLLRAQRTIQIWYLNLQFVHSMIWIHKDWISPMILCPTIPAENALLQEEVMSMHQMVQDVNAMAEDMDKRVHFSIMLVSAEARGLERGSTEVSYLFTRIYPCKLPEWRIFCSCGIQVQVKMVDEMTGNEFHWTKAKFLNRQVHMQEMYKEFDETNEVPNISQVSSEASPWLIWINHTFNLSSLRYTVPSPQEQDPFWDPPNTPVLIGIVSLPLNYLSHMLDFQEDPLTVLDSSAKQCGFLKVDLIPCDPKGNEDVDLCVENPMDLVGIGSFPFEYSWFLL